VAKFVDVGLKAHLNLQENGAPFQLLRVKKEFEGSKEGI